MQTTPGLPAVDAEGHHTVIHFRPLLPVISPGPLRSRMLGFVSAPFHTGKERFVTNSGALCGMSRTHASSQPPAEAPPLAAAALLCQEQNVNNGMSPDSAR